MACRLELPEAGHSLSKHPVPNIVAQSLDDTEISVTFNWLPPLVISIATIRSQFITLGRAGAIAWLRDQLELNATSVLFARGSTSFQFDAVGKIIGLVFED